MSTTNYIVIGAAVLLEAILFSILLIRLKVKKGRPVKYRKQWIELQKFCASKETWPLAVINADKLLSEALAKRKLKGRSTGEKMVSAQKIFTDNDKVWYAHNLAKKLIANSATKLREAEVKKALIGVRQALRDLGVLSDDK